MAFCPECRVGYDPGVVMCPECRAGLVDELPAEPGYEFVELVPLEPVTDVVSAAMLRGALESQGLHPVVRSHTVAGYGDVLRDWSTRTWGTILVPEDELAEARAVLQDFLLTAATSAPPPDEEPDAAPDAPSDAPPGAAPRAATDAEGEARG